MSTHAATPSVSGPDQIAAAWRQIRAENPKARARDVARMLGVSEAALVASGCGESAVRLAPDWACLLYGLPALGRVMALTRNEAVVHERYGQYRNVSVNGHVSLVLGEDIDLRLFLTHWRHAFAVTEAAQGRERRSIQVFDAEGCAVHKVYLTDDSDHDAFGNLVRRLTAADQTPDLRVAVAQRKAPRLDSEIDLDSLRRGWLALEDTHDFHGLLRRHGAVRLQAFRLAGEDLARPTSRTSARRILEAAAQDRLPIMIFVGNPGAIQIHSGLVTRLFTAGPWFNVLDPDFNLHLREDMVESAWVVRKPTRDGDVTSVELFDKDGECILMIFGKRKPGAPEDLEWRRLAHSLPGDRSLQ